jgi:hypothetical protein
MSDREEHMDALSATYLVAFVAGGTFALLSFVLGHLGHGHGHLHGHGHGHGHGPAPATGHGHAPAHASGHGHATPTARAGGSPAGGALRLIAPLANLTALSALGCVGGGVGLAVRHAGMSAATSVFWALPSGLAAAYSVAAFIGWLARGTRYASEFPLEGALGTVLARIGAGTTGEVLFDRPEARTTLPARSDSGSALEVGTEVIVLGVDRGIVRVAAINGLLEKERSS